MELFARAIRGVTGPTLWSAASGSPNGFLRTRHREDHRMDSSQRSESRQSDSEGQGDIRVGRRGRLSTSGIPPRVLSRACPRHPALGVRLQRPQPQPHKAHRNPQAPQCFGPIGKETGRINRHGQVLAARPLSESSLNHRLSALANFYVLLNGKRGYNPCLDVDRFVEPDRKINAIDFKWVQRILAKLPTDNVHGAIAECLAWTGMRPSQLNRIRRCDVDLPHATIWVPAGKGGRANPIGLPKPGVRAFRRLLKFADVANIFSLMSDRAAAGRVPAAQRQLLDQESRAGSRVPTQDHGLLASPLACDAYAREGRIHAGGAASADALLT